MRPFKKHSFLGILAVMTILGIATGPEAADFLCTTSVGIPLSVRWEGFAEYVADISVICTGGTPGVPVTSNFQIFLNTNITSNLLDNASPPTTEALLLLNDPPPASQVLGTNVFRGLGVNTNSIAWLGVTFNQPGDTGTLVIRITNIRVNARSLPLSSPPSQVLVYISASGGTSVPITNPQQVVGFPQQGLDYWVSDYSPSGFNLNFEEFFPSAFKKKIEVNASGNPISQNEPGLMYFTESGFTTNFSPTDLTGKADTGTRLVARFKNLPSGISLVVPTTVLSNNNPFLMARLLSGVNPDFSGGSTASSGNIVISNNSGVAVWEIMGGPGINGGSTIDTFVIPVTVSGGSGFGSGLVYGGIGPVNSIPIMDQSAPEPRFYDIFSYNYLPFVSK